MEVHATRVIVWDVPTAIECGAPFRVKVGVKCAAECGAGPRRVEVRDEHGDAVASGVVGDVPSPGTSALYFAEIGLRAPKAEGVYAWEAGVADVLDVATGTASQTPAIALEQRQKQARS